MSQIDIDDRKLGQYLLRKKLLDQATINRALEIQRDLPFLRMGEILLGLRAITFRDLIEALYSQFSEALFGHILVRRQLTTPERLDEALRVQESESHQRRLGQILVEMGEVTEGQIQEALDEREQYKEYKLRLGHQRYFEETPEQLLKEAQLLDQGSSDWVGAIVSAAPRPIPVDPGHV